MHSDLAVKAMPRIQQLIGLYESLDYCNALAESYSSMSESVEPQSRHELKQKVRQFAESIAKEFGA